jgi:hypothetical protein
MDLTRLSPFPDIGARDVATGYLEDKPQSIIPDSIAKLGGNDWNLKGNGGVQASTMDMERFYRGLTQSLQGISSAVVASVTTPQEHLDGRSLGGLWSCRPPGCEQQALSYRAQPFPRDILQLFWLAPQQDIFIYVVGNNGEKDVRAVVNTVLKIVLIKEGLMAATPPKPN